MSKGIVHVPKQRLTVNVFSVTVTHIIWCIFTKDNCTYSCIWMTNNQDAQREIAPVTSLDTWYFQASDSSADPVAFIIFYGNTLSTPDLRWLLQWVSGFILSAIDGYARECCTGDVNRKCRSRILHRVMQGHRPICVLYLTVHGLCNILDVWNENYTNRPS